MTGSFVWHDRFFCLANFYTALREPQEPPSMALLLLKNGKCSFGTLVFCREKRRKKKKKLELGKGTCYAVGTVAELFYLAHEVYVQKLGLYVCTGLELLAGNFL